MADPHRNPAAANRGAIRRFTGRIAAAARSAPEALIAIVLGVAAAGFGIFDGLEPKALSEVTLLVLSVFALSVVIDREERTKLSDAVGKLRGEVDDKLAGVEDKLGDLGAEVGNRLTDLESDVASLLSGEPYHVVSYTPAIDIRAGGREARTARTKKITFEQNSVLSISDFSESTGSTEGFACAPGFLKRVDEFSLGGQMYSLISLGRPYNRGEELEFTVGETFRDAFIRDREDWAVEVQAPMDRVNLRVRWAPDRGVERVFIERFGRQTEVPRADWAQSEDGHLSYTYSVDQPNLGETIRIVWDWADPLPPAAA